MDRTDQRTPEYVGFLGDTARNLSRVRLVADTSQYRNVAVVAGEGQGEDRIVVVVDRSDGQERRELYVNAADLTSRYTTENPDGTIQEHTMTPEEYAARLEARGLQAMAETLVGSSLTAELAQSMLLFGQDYELGDILPLSLARYGVQVKARLSKVTIVYEEIKSIRATMEVIV